MKSSEEPTQLLAELQLTEYEVTALEALLTHGRTTAPNLAEATGIPKARIYGVLDELADKGFVNVIPGRPKKYHPRSPEEILDRAVEDRRQSFESYSKKISELKEPFLETFQPRYEQAGEDITPTEELFYVVDVGKPSESETRAIYRDATDVINVITKSFEYLDAIEPTLADALDRGVEVNVLFLHPCHLSTENQEQQATIRAQLTESYPEIEFRFSEEPLPWRGTLADPSMSYESGTAIFLVEEKDVPLHMRQAAVTENGSFVAGMKRYFDLVWEYESVDAVD